MRLMSSSISCWLTIGWATIPWCFYTDHNDLLVGFNKYINIYLALTIKLTAKYFTFFQWRWLELRFSWSGGSQTILQFCFGPLSVLKICRLCRCSPIKVLLEIQQWFVLCYVTETSRHTWKDVPITTHLTKWLFYCLMNFIASLGRVTCVNLDDGCCCTILLQLCKLALQVCV